MSVRKKVLIAAIAAAVLGGAIFGIVKLIQMGNAEKSNDQAVYVQAVSEISGKGLWGQINRYAGTVESPESWSYTLREGGKVKDVYVRVGDVVQRGQKLFSYDTTEEESTIEEARIELERMEAELEKSKKNIDTLEKAIARASQTDKPPLQIELENEKLEIKKAEMQITAKRKEIEGLETYTGSPEVASMLDGVVTSINNGNPDYEVDSRSNSFITVVKVGDFRIKAEVNEMNINDLMESAPVIVTSRVDGTTWHGSIELIDRERPDMIEGGSMESSTSYPFYVTLEDCDGLMLGQHVYVEVNRGQNDPVEREGVWISNSYIVDIDTDAPYVYADDGKGRLVKKALTIGERDDTLLQSQITSGLVLTDRIALPIGNVKEGLPTTGDITALLNQYGEPSGIPENPGTASGGGFGYGEYPDESGIGFGDGEPANGTGNDGLGYGEPANGTGNDGLGYGEPDNQTGNDGFGYGDPEGEDMALALAGGDEI